MDIFDVLNLIGGLCLFLFGMDLMGSSLEKRAGSGLRNILRRLTGKKSAGLLTGLGITSVIQSSSATTVMVVGFVNSGLMTLSQAINVIMGANIGTTITAWVLSLGGIDSSNIFVKMLKPTSFTPILALIGIILYMFFKDDKKKITGTIFLGFATLMFGMETMSTAVAGLKNVPEFAELFLLFKNPVLGVLAGAILTGIIQSSSASVGILQALSSTGAVSLGVAIPIIMGQNIGTCVTAMLSSVGTNKNARRAALVHLLFNIIGTVICLIVFIIIDIVISPALFSESANHFNIAVCHSVFNIACVVILLPQSGLLEKIVCKFIPDEKKPEVIAELDELLLATPVFALEQSRRLAIDMANTSVSALKSGIGMLTDFDSDIAAGILEAENKTDHYEDILGTYLVKLSSHDLDEASSAESGVLLKVIGDFERIADFGANILQSVEEIRDKEIKLTDNANAELKIICDAVCEVVDLAHRAFIYNDLVAAHQVEPLEQVIDNLKEQLRTRHIIRLQQGQCSIPAGFVWADLLTSLERTSDHCSNIAGCIIEMAQNDLNIHMSLNVTRTDDENYKTMYRAFNAKYTLPAEA